MANVKWIDPENVDVPADDATDYAVDIGSFSEGVQTTKLTIKTTKLVTLNSAGTYKCSVTSTLYAGSPSSQKTVTITPIGKCFKLVFISLFLYVNALEELFLRWRLVFEKGSKMVHSFDKI